MTFECPRCGMVSHNQKDADEGYCGACHRWTRNELAWWEHTFGNRDPDWPWIDAMRERLLFAPGPMGDAIERWMS